MVLFLSLPRTHFSVLLDPSQPLSLSRPMKFLDLILTISTLSRSSRSRASYLSDRCSLLCLPTRLRRVPGPTLRFSRRTGCRRRPSLVYPEQWIPMMVMGRPEGAVSRIPSQAEHPLKHTDVARQVSDETRCPPLPRGSLLTPTSFSGPTTRPATLPFSRD